MGRRLVVLKQVFQSAIVLSRDTVDVSRILAILQLDFCVETLLKIVASALGPATQFPGNPSGYFYKVAELQSKRYNQKSDFSRLFDEVVAIYRDPSKGISKDIPPLRTEMQYLHELRNDVQHQGTTPSPEDVLNKRALAESFLSSVIADVFDRKLEEIFLSDMVPHDQMRTLIREAELNLGLGKYKESCVASAKTFQILTLLEGALEYERAGYLSRPIQFEISELEKIDRRIERLEDQMLTLSVGADYRRFLKFKERMPSISASADWSLNVHERENWNPTKEDAVEALDFVFSTVMKWISTTPVIPDNPWNSATEDSDQTSPPS
jgi:hypothetical protein